MSMQEMLSHTRQARYMAKILALVVVLIASSALIGWQAQRPALMSWIALSGPMSPNTAIGLCVAGLGLILAQRPGRRAGLVLLATSGGFGLAHLLAVYFGTEFDQLFLR